MVRDGWDCDPNILDSIAYFHPASCTHSKADNLVAQIDQFFSVHRTNGNAGGVVFIDGKTIDRWVKTSSFLQQADRPIVLAIRMEELTNEQLLSFEIMGTLTPLGIVVAIICYHKEKLKDIMEKIKDKCTSKKGCLPSQANNSASETAADQDHTTNVNPAVIDIDGDDAESRSPYLGDFSSSAEELEELQAIVITAKPSTEVIVDGSPGDETSEVV